MNDFNGKVVIVTGGSTGIGSTVAIKIAEAGAKVLITGRNEETLKKTASLNENISYVVADVSQQEGVEKTIQMASEKFGKIDVLVNNAGVAFFAPLESVDKDHYDVQFDTNVRGVIKMSQKALPYLEKSSGNIVNIASSVADTPLANASVYSATKAAVVAITKALAKELAPKGIRVNVVSPGPIETPIFGKMGIPEDQLNEMAKGMKSMIPLQRFGKSEEVADAVMYLSASTASFVTGAQLLVDGGFTA